MVFVYIMCLTIGLFYSIITLVVGHHDGDFHSDPGEVGVDSVEGISPFKPVVIGTFITFFGAFGLIGTYSLKWTMLIALLLAAGAGLFAAAFVFYAVVRVLYKNQSNSTISSKGLKGIRGNVITPIPKNGFGEISYNTGGSIYISPAKSLDEEEIPKGEKIIIVEMKNNVAAVIKSPKL